MYHYNTAVVKVNNVWQSALDAILESMFYQDIKDMLYKEITEFKRWCDEN